MDEQYLSSRSNKCFSASTLKAIYEYWYENKPFPEYPTERQEFGTMLHYCLLEYGTELPILRKQFRKQFPNILKKNVEKTMKTVYEGVPLSGRVDLIYNDAVYDIKTTSTTLEGDAIIKSFIKWNYAYQMAVYRILAKTDNVWIIYTKNHQTLERYKNARPVPYPFRMVKIKPDLLISKEEDIKKTIRVIKHVKLVPEDVHDGDLWKEKLMNAKMKVQND